MEPFKPKGEAVTRPFAEGGGGLRPASDLQEKKGGGNSRSHRPVEKKSRAKVFTPSIPTERGLWLSPWGGGGGRGGNAQRDAAQRRGQKSLLPMSRRKKKSIPFEEGKKGERAAARRQAKRGQGNVTVPLFKKFTYFQRNGEGGGRGRGHISKEGGGDRPDPSCFPRAPQGAVTLPFAHEEGRKGFGEENVVMPTSPSANSRVGKKICRDRDGEGKGREGGDGAVGGQQPMMLLLPPGGRKDDPKSWRGSCCFFKTIRPK